MEVYNEVNCATLKGISKGKSPFDIINLSLVGDGSPVINYPSKTFKISPMYKLLYHSCFDAVNLNKTPLLQALIAKDIGEIEAQSLNLYDFNGLFQSMILHLKESLNDNLYREISNKVNLHNRFKVLNDIYNSKNVKNNNLVMMSFRIPDYFIEEIYKIKIETLGDVVELAIGYFLITCDDQTFEYIRLSFSQAEPFK